MKKATKKILPETKLIHKLDQAILIVLLSCAAFNVNAQSPTWLTHDIVEPYFLYHSSNYAPEPYYRTADEACRASMPPRPTPKISEQVVITYSDPRGGFQPQFGFGCFYKVVYAFSSTGQIVDQYDDLFHPNWVVPEKRCPVNYAWNNVFLKEFCVRKIPTYDDTCPILNPIYPGTGTKIQKEIDFSSPKISSIIQRTYFSRNVLDVSGIIGYHWFLSPLDKKLVFKELGAEPYVYALRSPNMFYQYADNTSGLVGEGSDQNSLIRLSGSNLPAAYEYHDAEAGSVERYDENGKILSIKTRNGVEVIVQYSVFDASNPASLPSGLPISLADNRGNHFALSYNDNSMLQKIVHSPGTEVTYFYEDSHDSSLLTGVAYSDGSGKTYQYDNSIINIESVLPDDNFVNRGARGSVSIDEIGDINKDTYVGKVFGSYASRPLAAIIDENGNTFSEWRYNSDGYVVEALHGNITMGSTDVSQMWDAVDPKVTFTNPLGKKTTYHYIDVAGVRKISHVEGHQSENCAAANKNYTYYPSGLLKTKTDWKNNTTSYQYNTRNLESSRTEAHGTPQERTITTEWHPTFNLRTKITEPGRETNFIYDAEGRLLSQSSNKLPLN